MSQFKRLAAYSGEGRPIMSGRLQSRDPRGATARFPSLRTVLAILAVVLCAGCGGGGGSSAPPFDITSGPPSNGATGIAYPGFTFVASNGVAPVSWTASGALPPGLSLNASGQLLGMPVTAGTYSFTVAAADSSNPPHDATATVSLQISDSMIVVGTNPQPPSGTATYPYAGYTFTVASGGSPPFTWEVTAGSAPTGLTLGNNGSLSGLPTSAGSFSFSVTVTDSAPTPQHASAPFTITVGTPTAPIVSTTPPPAGTATYPYNGGTAFSFGASGGLAPYVWTVTTGAVPAGLTLGSDGMLSGTPTTAGTVTFTVTATDSAQPPAAGSQPFTIAVTNPGPPVINPTPAPPAGVAGNSYPGFGFTATGGYLPLTWAVTAGALPAGLSLASSGSLVGVPTTSGSFPFTVTVTDSAPTPAMNSAPFTIAIAAPPPPTIDAWPPPPTGTVGTAYPAFTFTATNGYPPLAWSETGALPTGLGMSAGGVLSGTPGNAGEFLITVDVTDALSHSAPSELRTVRVSLARPAASFTWTTGTMNVARSAHTATLLQNGHVLVAGGSDASGPLASAELYEPANQIFTVTGSMRVARSGHTATLLADAVLQNSGKVLLAGGGSQTAELYDPTVGRFTATGNMVGPHTGQTATLLQDGQVLVAGGETASAELYNPSTGTFIATGSMTVSRSGHSATLLLNGQVLIAGGGTATAELYDPAKSTFTATGSMSESRTGHTAALLTNAALPNYGKVVVAGPDLTAESFEPATGTFSLVGNLAPTAATDFYGATQAARGATAFPRNDGAAVIAGGYGVVTVYTGGGYSCSRTQAKVSVWAAQLFAPESEGFTATGDLNHARYGHAATVLADGTVLITGGVLGVVKFGSPSCFRGNWAVPVSVISRVLSSAELYK